MKQKNMSKMIIIIISIILFVIVSVFIIMGLKLYSSTVKPNVFSGESRGLLLYEY